MKKLLCLVFLGPVFLIAQQPDRLSFGYFGESAIHPGVKVGAEWELLSTDKTRSRWTSRRRQKIGDKVVRHELVAGTSVGAYHFPNNHNGWLLHGELGWRKTWLRKGRFIGAGVGIGGLYKAYNLPVYRLDDGAEPGTDGYAQFTPLLSMSYGRDLERALGMPVSWFIKPVFWAGIPQAHTIVPNAGLELGIHYHL